MSSSGSNANRKSPRLSITSILNDSEKTPPPVLPRPTLRTADVPELEGHFRAKAITRPESSPSAHVFQPYYAYSHSNSSSLHGTGGHHAYPTSFSNMHLMRSRSEDSNNTSNGNGNSNGNSSTDIHHNYHIYAPHHTSTYPYTGGPGVPGVPGVPSIHTLPHSAGSPTRPTYQPQTDYAASSQASATVPLVQKNRRFRRRYYQIHRKYSCFYPECTKSYGSLNHLNTHIVTKKHGQRKSKADFKHIDKQGTQDDITSGDADNGADHSLEEDNEDYSSQAVSEKEDSGASSKVAESTDNSPKPASNPLTTTLSNRLNLNATFGNPGMGGTKAAPEWIRKESKLPSVSTLQSSATRLPSLPSIVGQCSSS